MKGFYSLAAVTLVTIGSAVAQTTSQPPGGNVPVAQSPCARGYESTVKDGRMQIGSETMKSIDTNGDGRISKSEFDSACARKLFDDTEKKG